MNCCYICFVILFFFIVFAVSLISAYGVKVNSLPRIFQIGDRIIEVDGVDLRQSTHERAVEVIQAAGNPVCLLVQSLVHLVSRFFLFFFFFYHD